jgi:hypothetical protein
MKPGTRAATFFALISSGCAAELEQQLETTRVERDASRLEAEQATAHAARARLEADQARAVAATLAEDNAALREQNESLASRAAPASGLFQGRFRFAGRVGRVEVTIRGGAIDETFTSDDKGRIAVELPAGKYSATAVAKGHAPLEFEFVIPGSSVLVEPLLERGKKPAAPTP